MNASSQGKPIKKTVGKKKQSDVWDELYRLNQFVAKITPLQPSDDGHALRKIVGKPRAR